MLKNQLLKNTHLCYISPMNFSTKPDPKKLDDILEKSSLGSILRKAKVIADFNTALTRHLPTNLNSHCQAMNFENSILIIGVDDAAWLTRLRFEEQDLIEKLQREALLPNVLGINYKIYY